MRKLDGLTAFLILIGFSVIIVTLSWAYFEYIDTSRTENAFDEECVEMTLDGTVKCR